MKTKCVAGIDLLPEAFAFCGDVEEPATWKLPLFFRGNEALTRNHIKNALHRFADTKGIPDSERAEVWRLIAGAAKAHGIKVPASGRPAPATVGAHPYTAESDRVDEIDPELKQARAVGALAAEKLLKRMGYGI